MVCERVLARPLPNLHLRAVEVAHRPAAGIGHGGEHVVLAAVDLFLVLVVQVPGTGQQFIHAPVDRRQVDAERAVRQSRHRGIVRVGFAVLVRRRQVQQPRAVVIQLRLLFRRGAGDAFGARKQAVEVVEAAVLGVDHHDVLDAREPDI